jgi:hypothetical protein
MTPKNAQKRYVVWVRDNQGRWRPSVAMPENEARNMAHQLDAEGRHCKVVTAPTFDPGEEE